MKESEHHALRMCLHELVDMIDNLHEFVMESAHFPDTISYRRKFINQLGELHRLFAEIGPSDDPSDAEFHDRLLALEERESEREADKKRPVEVTLIRGE